MEFRLALSDGSVRLFERDGDAGVYSERLLETWTPAQLASLRSRNSELVEVLRGKVAEYRRIATGYEGSLKDLRDVEGWYHAGSAMADTYRKIADELESLLTPDPATTNSKEKI